MDNQITKSMLSVGLEVEVNPRDDRTRQKLINGEIEEILAGRETHTHGILVRLTSGITGRVKKIILSNGVIKQPKINPESEITFAELIEQDETSQIEFKGALLWSQEPIDEGANKNSPEFKQYGRDASRIIIAKTIGAFLNTNGGNLLIGVFEEKGQAENNIVGIEVEYKKLKDKDEDGYRRKIVDDVIKVYFPELIFNHFDNYLSINFETYQDKRICHIKVNRSDCKVFLNIKGSSLFMIRVDATSRKLEGEAMVNYCEKRFK